MKRCLGYKQKVFLTKKAPLVIGCSELTTKESVTFMLLRKSRDLFEKAKKQFRELKAMMKRYGLPVVD